MSTLDKQEKRQRMRIAGLVLMGLAIACCGFAFFAFNRFSQREIYYLLSALSFLLGIYCLADKVD